MATKYLDSRRIEGLDTDIVSTPSYNPDFSSNTGWSESDSTKNTVNTSLGRIDFDLRRDTSVDSMAYDLGYALSDTAWTVRFRIHIDNVYNVDSSALRAFIGMSDGNHTQHHAVAQDAIGMFIIHGVGSTERDWKSCWSNGASTESNLVELGTNLNDARNGYDSYIEIIRTSSSTAQVSVSSTDAYDGDIASNLITNISGVTGLRYFVIKNTDTSYSNTTNRTDGWIDNLVIYNGTTTNKPAPLLSLSGCKAYYNFEQTSGSLTNIATTANGFDDGLGSSADGTSSGGVTQNATGKVGSYAWDFDGSNDYVNVSGITLPAYNSTDTFSVSAWINMDTLATSPTQYQRLFHWYDGTKQWQLYIFSSGVIGFNNTQANQGVDTSSSVISTGTWYHLVVVKTGNNTYKIYLNGVDQSTTSTGGGNPSPSIQTFRIGASITGSGSDGHFNGRIDEFSVFTRALTSLEVSALYNSGTGVAVNDSSITVKPETNSIFVESDSARRYWFDGSNWQGNSVTYDNQAIIQNGSVGSSAPTTFSNFTVGNNPNRILVVACGSYNSSPDITGITWNGSESFTHIVRHTHASAYKVELWYLVNPTPTTANVVISSSGMGQMGAIVYSFYNVDQSAPIGAVTKYTTTSATTTPSLDITPTNTGSMIVDCWYNGADTPTPNNALTDGMNIICGGVDRSMASQYSLTPTIGSVNSMSRTAGGGNGYVQIACEIKNG